MKCLWYEVTLVWSDFGLKWLVWSALVWSALVWSAFGMKWLRYEVTCMKWPWYEVTLVWSDLGMKWLVWSELVWSDFGMKWLVWSDHGMKCRMVCSALVWSAWYEVTIFPFGMKWLKKWSDGWMKWLGTSQEIAILAKMFFLALNSCGPIHQLYKFSSDASVLCNGGKTCTVTCPGNLKPNHAELTCLIPKRRKMKPVIVR